MNRADRRRLADDIIASLDSMANSVRDTFFATYGINDWWQSEDLAASGPRLHEQIVALADDVLLEMAADVADSEPEDTVARIARLSAGTTQDALDAPHVAAILPRVKEYRTEVGLLEAVLRKEIDIEANAETEHDLRQLEMVVRPSLDALEGALKSIPHPPSREQLDAAEHQVRLEAHVLRRIAASLYDSRVIGLVNIGVSLLRWGISA